MSVNKVIEKTNKNDNQDLLTLSRAESEATQDFRER